VTRILAVDYGSKRVGLAISDPLGLGATPHDVIDRHEAEAEVARLVSEKDIGLIIVGLPTSLGGHEGPSAIESRNFGESLGRLTGVEVVFRDERFTSRIAEDRLLESGMKRRDRFCYGIWFSRQNSGIFAFFCVTRNY
jgi:putative Holliday junction resolvase